MSWRLTVEEIASATGGKALSGLNSSVSGVATDSRKSMQGQLFVALLGENFDGHDFCAAAIEKGAGVILIHKKDLAEQFKSKVGVVLVADTLKALQALGRFWRKKHKFFVQAVTGSNGKTSTKEFAKTLISAHKRCHASQGSFNNHWGVPLSLLAAPPDTEVVIQEMGMNAPGEIRDLVHIAEPDVTLVTMVGSAHIGGLGSQENIAKAKAEIYESAPKALQIFNLDNEWTLKMFNHARKAHPAAQRLTFSSFQPDADVLLRVTRLVDYKLEVVGRIAGAEGEVLVPVIGRQNVVNLMAAACMALSAKIPPEKIWQQLPDCRTAWGRNQLLSLPVGAKIIFDAYNANPESMAALIRNQLEMDVRGRRVAILGEMRELGDRSAEAHHDLGALVARAGVDIVWFVGPHCADFELGLKREGFKKTYFISDTYQHSLATKIGSMLNDQDLVVIKGSRAMQLEQVLEAWHPIETQ